MQYMLVLTAAPEAWEENAPVDDGVIDDWALYTRALADAGVLVGGHGLNDPGTSTTVRIRAGEQLLTDGPFTDTKEHLIGYYVIEADQLDVAIAWASKAPNARIGSVEIRPIIPGSSTVETLARIE